MKQPNSLFENQGVPSLESIPVEDSKNLGSFVHFVINKSHFACPIESVLEVTEWQDIVPYPENFDGHIGVVSLRGKIIPVRTLGDLSFENKQSRTRLMVFEFSHDRIFCVPVESPRKIELDESKANNDIVTYDGEPTKIVSEKDFIGEVKGDAA